MLLWLEQPCPEPGSVNWKLELSSWLAMQLTSQLGFWRYAIEVKPFLTRLARAIVSRLSKRGLEFVVEYSQVSVGRHQHSGVT
jgi:hypothetical protein